MRIQLTHFLCYWSLLYIAITFGTPSETHGEVRAFSMIYSGNFLFEADIAELGRLRVNMGINPMGFQWELQQGKIQTMICIKHDLIFYFCHSFFISRCLSNFR